jgi:hypothetical protein
MSTLWKKLSSLFSSGPQDLGQRVLNTFWQSILSSIAVTQLAAAVAGGHWTVAESILLTALGAGVGAVLALLKNLVFKPAATGVAGLAERVLATFLEGAGAAIPIVTLTGAIQHLNLRALESVALTALGGGIAAVLALLQHAGKPTPTTPAGAAADVTAAAPAAPAPKLALTTGVPGGAGA